MVKGNGSWIGQRPSPWQSLNINCLDVNDTLRQPESVSAYADPHIVSANGSWIGQRYSAWQSLNFNHLDVNATVRQPESRPAYVNAHIISANAGLNRYHTSDLHVDEGIKIKDEGLFVQQHSFPRIEISIPAMNLYQDKQQSVVPSELDGKATPRETSYRQQKKFLIFDQSGEETHMLLSTLYSPICNPAAISSNPFSTYELPRELHAFKTEESRPKVPGMVGSGENHVTDESSDYREDTEEINALLYSDHDGDDFCDSEDEDEMSTGHSPISKEAGLNNPVEGEEFDEEVTSLGRSTKRQKLLDGDSCGKLCSVDTKVMENSAPSSFRDESVVDLNSSNGEQASPTVGCKRSRKHKIHDTLRILQKLIPGSKSSKDPLIIIDGAIDYLKSLKAESPQMEEAEGSSWLGPCV